MEERIIDDEYGRGIRLKKTENGYVDATDELTEETADQPVETDTEETEEVLFSFPEEDDEELAALSAEEATALLKKREEERKEREKKANELIAEGERLLDSARAAESVQDKTDAQSEESIAAAYRDAEKAFDEALMLIACETRASCGLWRAKTRCGKNLQPLLDEWGGYEIEEFEGTYGEEAVKILSAEWKQRAEEEKRAKEGELTPLKEKYDKQTQKRREILAERKFSARKRFIPALSVQLALLVLTIVFACNIFSRADATFVWLTGILGVVSVVFLPFFCTALSKYVSALSLSRKNESLSSTADGRRVQQLLDETDFLSQLLSVK